MPKVTFIDARGARVPIEAANGDSAMRVAIDNGLSSIVGECGGACQCATCHVYVEEPWKSLLPPPSEMELSMLEGVYAEQRATSRLSCEIILTDQLDGIELKMPDRQR